MSSQPVLVLSLFTSNMCTFDSYSYSPHEQDDVDDEDGQDVELELKETSSAQQDAELS